MSRRARSGRPSLAARIRGRALAALPATVAAVYIASTMTATLIEREGRRLLVADAEGRPLGSSRDALDLIGEAFGQRAEVIVIPTARLDPEFLRLLSGLLGEFVQKVINYRLKLAVIGDLSAAIAASDALRDFVRECDRGRDVLFVPDVAALLARLAAHG
jgi:hypothetical protein